MKEELPKPTPDRDPDREKGSIPEDFGLKPGGVEKIRKERKPRRSEAEDEFPAKAPPIPKEETISRPESGSQILDQAEPAESPVSPSLESKTGTPQAPEAQPPTNELLDPRLQAAAQHVIMRKDATPAMLERYLNVNTAEADDLIARLQKLGVVGPWRKNRREVNWTIDDLKQRIGIKPTRTAAPKTPEPAPSKKENKETLASPTDTPAPAAQKTGRYVRLPGAARPEPAEAPPTPETLPPLVAEQPSKPEKTREEAIIASINQAESSFAVILTSLNQNLTNLEKQLRTEATFRAETEIRGVTQTLENSIRDLRTQRELLEAGKITAEQAEVITSSTIIKAQNKLNEVKELLGGLALDETPQTQPKTETPATAAASEKPSQPETTETRKRSWISRHRR
ncbi:MAG: hypothetical protein HY093_03380, partial [Candidatus Liptonbacteria bacterium]|nr:hypothetical protein [Candidatus Liptonbacteria bacterium]